VKLHISLAAVYKRQVKFLRAETIGHRNPPQQNPTALSGEFSLKTTESRSVRFQRKQDDYSFAACATFAYITVSLCAVVSRPVPCFVQSARSQATLGSAGRTVPERSFSRPVTLPPLLLLLLLRLRQRFVVVYLRMFVCTGRRRVNTPGTSIQTSRLTLRPLARFSL